MSKPVSLEMKDRQKAIFLEWYASLPEGKYLRTSLRASFKQLLKDRGLHAGGLEFNALAKSVKFLEMKTEGLRCYQKGGVHVRGKVFGDVPGGIKKR